MDWAVGRYRSADADCTLEIARAAEGLTATFSDGLGVASGPLTALSEQVALAATIVGGRPFGMAITFRQPGASAAGLKVNTGRTRALAFERC